MVRAAKVKQVAAEKRFKEANNKVSVQCFTLPVISKSNPLLHGI